MSTSREAKLEVLLRKHPKLFKLTNIVTAQGDRIPEVTISGGSKFTCKDEVRKGFKSRKEVVAHKLLIFLQGKWFKTQERKSGEPRHIQTNSTNSMTHKKSDPMDGNIKIVQSLPETHTSSDQFEESFNLLSSLMKKNE